MSKRKGLPKSKPLGPAPEARGVDIVRDYCSRFPDAPSKTLARQIYRDYPDYFSSLDICYKAVRRVFGVAGADSCKRDKRLHRPPRPPGYIPKPERGLDWTPTKLGDGATLVISDIHFPYHAEKPLRVALAKGKEVGVDNILLNGDILDNHQISRHGKRPDEARYATELQMAQMFFDHLREEFPKARIMFKLGNHEERLESFICERAKMWWGLPALDWSNLLNLGDFGIELLPEKSPIMAGELAIFHGHELPRGMTDPVNPARGLFLRCLEHTMAGHWHKSSQHSESTQSGHIITTFSVACLCTLRPRWLPVNKWCHGFAVVDHKRKEFSVDNYRVVNGKAYS